MKYLSKREIILVMITIALAIILIMAIIALNSARSKCNDLSARNCALQEEKNDIDDTNMKLLEALRREHRIALSNDTKLLVADLAWLDRENDTFYMDAFVDLESDEGNCFKRLKKLFDNDKEARERAINIVCYHLDYLELYSVTSDYYDQLVAESAAG